ncbi:MAG TPA: 2-amino-4-hydroxy-6-hydroxymethyldihydropteridine diphosphokinase [Anaerolineales bacterium]|nr:2-amino-4-hydroxy-6-hydroxymethyldihydropteridine diphosphokinase [Anaerolineales bacterium]
MPVVYVSLGTNLGDRLANLRSAVDALRSMPGMVVLAESGIYETPAWGYEDQPTFLNMAVKAETNLEPHALLTRLKELEKELGRTPTFHWGPRVIDMDILFYDDLLLNTPELVIPHPRLQDRAFVLVPLADIATDVMHPVLHRTVGEMLAAVDAKEIKRFGEET